MTFRLTVLQPEGAGDPVAKPTTTKPDTKTLHTGRPQHVLVTQGAGVGWSGGVGYSGAVKHAGCVMHEDMLV